MHFALLICSLARILRGAKALIYINNNIVIEYLFRLIKIAVGFFIISKTNCVGTLNL